MALQNPDNNFPLDFKWDYTQIDFVNASINPVTIDIFDAITITNFSTNPLSPFHIDSPYNYNALLQDVQSNPMMIRRIELITQNQIQLTQPLNLLTRDANGFQCMIPRLPNIELSVNQIQPNICMIDFREKELILDDNSLISQYTFPANSSTRMLLYYKQINRIDIFTKGISNCIELEDYLNFKEISITESKLRKISNEPVIINKINQKQLKEKRLVTKKSVTDKFKSLV